MRLLTIILIISIIILIVYVTTVCWTKKEGFENNNCTDVDDDGYCIDDNNEECEIDENGDCIDNSEDCEVDEDGYCLEGGGDEEDYEEDNDCEVDEEGYCIEDSNEEEQNPEDFKGEEEETNLDKLEKEQIKKAGLTGIIGFRKDPIHIGQTVKGVIEKVPRERLNEYIKLFKEPESYNTTQYETTKCILKTDKNNEMDNCYNVDIKNNFKKGKCIPKPNMLQCDALYNDDLMDPADYYKEIIRPIETKMNDDILKGYNYDLYSTFLKPQELNKKLFDKEEYNIPRGFTYAFAHTPSYE